jgi:hypothetical protein
MKQTEELKLRLRREIDSANGSLLKDFPVETYLDLLERYPASAGYQYVSPEVKSYTEHILKQSHPDTLELYHQLALVELISRGPVEKQDLPDAIKQLYLKNHVRILDSIASRSEGRGFYLYPNDKFFKDLAICTGKMIPIGARKLVTSALTPGFVFRQGLAQFIGGLRFMLFELGGIRPRLYQMHTDSHDPDAMAEFNPDGWVRSYLNVAELLKSRTEVKGIYGTSWFYDPKIEEISPKLSFVRKTITDNGGMVFYIGPSEQATRDALNRSPTRNKLYNEGKYVPTNYLIIWSRRRLIEWADRVTGVTGKND